MKRIGFIINTFAMITTLTLAAVAIFTLVLFPTDSISPFLLVEILGASLLCALSTLIFPWGRGMRIGEVIVRTVLHYLIINAIILGCGYLFGWYNIRNPWSVLVMMITIALIYGGVSAVSWKRSLDEAKRMNKKLQEYQKWS